MLSIIIPSRNDPHLQKTVDDIIAKSTTDIEIFVMLDGYWPSPELKKQDNLHIIHFGKAIGMRPLINAAARMVKGDYLLKCDAHVCFDHGFDEKLIEAAIYGDVENNWLQVPRRYQLDPKAWDRDLTKSFVDYMYIDPKSFKGKVLADKNPDNSVYDLMTFQGSCWFMPKTLFENIGGLDENYGTSGKEAQELGCKVWLSGGTVVRNTKTWYAHKSFPRTYSLPAGEREKSKTMAMDMFLNDRWPGAKRKFQWLIDKFEPPGWDEGQGSGPPQKRRVKIQGVEGSRGEKMNMRGSAASKKLVIDRQISTAMIESIISYLIGHNYHIFTDERPIIKPKFRRRHMADLFRELGFKKGAEIGVAWGRFSEVLCKAIPGLELYCVDPWSIQHDDPRHKKNHDENYAEASRRLKKYNATLMRMRSMDAAACTADESLDFVYIDGNHNYGHVKDDITEWSKKVKIGGIVSGHDYYRFKNAGVIEAVDEFRKENHIDIWYLTDEKAMSWFWVKE
jgi:hypothetical protein